MPPASNKTETTELSMKNTKQELLDAYNEALTQLKAKEKALLNPEQEARGKKEEKVLSGMSGMSADSITQDISKLKQDMGKLLTSLADKLAAEVDTFDRVQLAIEIKERELKDIYDIDRGASTLAALIESQHQQTREFELEMVSRKEAFATESNGLRMAWEKEMDDHRTLIKEQRDLEAKTHKRQEEEYKYAFDREQQLARNTFEDDKAKRLAELEALENQMKALREHSEKAFQDREAQIASKEREYESLQAQVTDFPEKLEAAVAMAVKECSERIKLEAGYQKDLLQKEYEGEKNVLTARIQSLEQTVREQTEQIQKLSTQQDSAYQKIQDVAVKAIEGASKVGSYSGLQQVLREQNKKQTNED